MPADAKLTPEERAHPQWLIALAIGLPYGAYREVFQQYAAAIRDAEDAALERAVGLIERAFEQSWVAQDLIDAVRSMKSKEGT